MLGFTHEKIAENIYRITNPCAEYDYLIVGSEKAILIDTGNGYGSLKEEVDKITDKPITVLLTHGHIDHANGSGEFEEVYLNPKDEYIYNEHSDDDVRRYWLGFRKNKEELEKLKYIPGKPFEFFKPLHDGDVFDIGCEQIEIIECPGHTKGMVAMLFRNAKILLTGDAANDITFMFDHYSISIEEYEEGLKRLKEKAEGRFERILTSHNSGELPPELIDGLIDLCEDIKFGRTDDVLYNFHEIHGFIAKKMDMKMKIREDGGLGNIIYNKDRIFAR